MSLSLVTLVAFRNVVLDYLVGMSFQRPLADQSLSFHQNPLLLIEKPLLLPQKALLGQVAGA
jgi:hypothetical protein